jgi:hypothetical protein
MRVLLLVFLLSLAAPVAGDQLTDDQVKQAIIAESIASYPGSCPCPYNRAVNGSKCGKRSAWSKVGGYSPICYSEEVTEAMVAAWRAAHGH